MANGSFRLTQGMAKLVDRDLQMLRNRAGELEGPSKTAERILATLIALHLFETRFDERRTEWQLLARKAEAWLLKQESGRSSSDLREWVKEVLDG